MSNLTKLIADESPFPRLYIRHALTYMKDKLGGAGELVDATNPVAMMLEAASSIGAGVMLGVQNQVRGLHSATAMNLTELYKHMTDDDFIGRFSDCATGNFMLFLDYDELIHGAYNGTMVIPKHLKVRVSGATFVTQYPIIIRVVEHGGITIAYDTTVVSALQSKYNVPLTWQPTTFGGRKHITISFTAPQVDVVTHHLQATGITALRQEVAYTDLFYYAQAYISQNGEWVPVTTTHIDDVYNPSIPTVCLRVLERTVVVVVPQAYYNNGLITGEVRLDVYTTKGPVSIAASALTAESFFLEYSPTSQNTTTPEIAAFLGLSRKAVMSPYDIVGGALGMSFEQLKTRVVNRQSAKLGLPITELQLSDTLMLEGFALDKVSDYVTNRVYVASRGFEEVTGRQTSSALSAQTASFTGFLYQLLSSPGVSNVSDRVVIRSGTLFRRGVTGLEVVDALEDSMLGAVANTNIDALCAQVNQQRYVYTPFHYVIDTRGNQVSMSAYQLGNPVIHGTELITTNLKVGISAMTSQHAIKFAETGYAMAVRCREDGIPTDLPENELKAVISWVVPGTTQRRYLHGVRTTTGRTWVFRFELLSSFDIDPENRLSIAGMASMLPLSGEFDLVYYTTIGSGSIETPDAILQGMDPAVPGVGICCEKVYFTLGNRLKRLWAPVRAIGDGSEYLRYEQTVYAIYPKDVYETDATGQIRIAIDSSTQTPTFIKLHSAGDTMVDEQGQPVVLHQPGEYVLDQNGQRVLKNGIRSMMFSFDLCLLDAVYKYATDPATTEYVQRCLGDMGYWADTALDGIAGQLLDRTALYFRPAQSAGSIAVITGEGIVREIAAEQRLTVTFDIYKSVYDDVGLRQAIALQTPEVIGTVLSATTISKTELESALMAKFKGSVLSVQVSGLFNDQFRAVTVADRLARPALAKRLEPTLARTLQVVNDLTIVFKPFDPGV